MRPTPSPYQWRLLSLEGAIFHFLFSFFLSVHDVRIVFPNLYPMILHYFRGGYMTLEQKILELTAEDGPNVPLRTLAIYCGTSHTTLSRFAHGKLAISEKMREQIE
jgi:hypothetical protein